VTKTTPPPLAPLGSEMVLLLIPNPLLAIKTIAGGSPKGAGNTPVLVGVGVPGTKGAVGTGGPAVASGEICFEDC